MDRPPVPGPLSASSGFPMCSAFLVIPYPLSIAMLFFLSCLSFPPTAISSWLPPGPYRFLPSQSQKLPL